MAGWRFGEGCCRRLRGSTLTLNFSMGLRPRLSAVAASRLTGTPGLMPRGLFSDTAATRLFGTPRAGAPGIAYLRIVAPAAGRGFGEGGVAAGRSWVGWRFGEGCCRRLRGSTLTLNFSMGLRPRLSAVAASAAYWNPRTGAPGDHFLTLPLRGFLEARAGARGSFV